MKKSLRRFTIPITLALSEPLLLGEFLKGLEIMKVESAPGMTVTYDVAHEDFEVCVAGDEPVEYTLGMELDTMKRPLRFMWGPSINEMEVLITEKLGTGSPYGRKEPCPDCIDDILGGLDPEKETQH